MHSPVPLHHCSWGHTPPDSRGPAEPEPGWTTRTRTRCSWLEEWPILGPGVLAQGPLLLPWGAWSPGHAGPPSEPRADSSGPLPHPSSASRAPRDTGVLPARHSGPGQRRPPEPTSPGSPLCCCLGREPACYLSGSRASCLDGADGQRGSPHRPWCSPGGPTWAPPRPLMSLVPSLQQLLLHPQPGAGGWRLWAPSTSCACPGSLLLLSTCLLLAAPNPNSGSSTSRFPRYSPECHHRVWPNLGSS